MLGEKLILLMHRGCFGVGLKYSFSIVKGDAQEGTVGSVLEQRRDSSVGTQRVT